MSDGWIPWTRLQATLLILKERGLHPEQVVVRAGLLVALQHLFVLSAFKKGPRLRVLVEPAFHGELGSGAECRVFGREGPNEC